MAQYGGAPTNISSAFLDNNSLLPLNNHGAINLDIGAGNIDGFSEGGQSELSSSKDGSKSKYSELLHRKNMRNQALVVNQQRQILAQQQQLM